MKIEWNDRDKVECHNCGKIKRGMWLFWFDYLCQHFITLCPKCFRICVYQLEKSVLLESHLKEIKRKIKEANEH